MLGIIIYTILWGIGLFIDAQINKSGKLDCYEIGFSGSGFLGMILAAIMFGIFTKLAFKIIGRVLRWIATGV